MTVVSTQGYDPVLYFHHLVWENRCFKAAPQEFQRLFEDIAVRQYPGFQRIRPYGAVGDRKADGLYEAEGVVFQVYSPDTLRQRDTLVKIEDDLSGAIKHWGDKLKRWVFVYNARSGLTPDIPRMLHAQEKKHPRVEISSLSNDDLWELVRGFPLQQRCELLGLPPEGQVDAIRKKTVLLIQDGLAPIDEEATIEALSPRLPYGPPVYVMPSWDGQSWESTAEFQRRAVAAAINKATPFKPHFALFSLAPVPLVVHLGYLLSDRVNVTPYQYHRERGSWLWNADADFDSEIVTVGMPRQVIKDAGDVTVRVSLSAEVSEEDSTAAAGYTKVQIDLRVSSPSRIWLQHPDQLKALDMSFRNALSAINRFVPDCERVHLFYAGPTGGALKIGQAINPRMDPRIVLYEYSRKSQPKYAPVLVLD